MLPLKVTGLLICLYVLGTYGADKYTDENRPYEFGFTIEGEQHRHEKKDENGIIMGEFGFITADGVYHVTVYATDEKGRFKILSMKNIRVKPYPTAGVKKGHSLPFPPSGNSPISQGPTTIKPQPDRNPELNKPIASPAKSCSHCSLPTTTTKAPQLTDIAVVSKDRPSSISTSQISTNYHPQLSNSGVLRQQAPASSLGPQNNATVSRFAQNSPQYQQKNTQQQIFGGQQSTLPNNIPYVQQKNVIDQNYAQPGLTSNQNQQANDINRNYPHPEIDQYQPALTGYQNLQTSGNNRNYPQQTIEQNYHRPGLEGNQNLQTSNINTNQLQSTIGQNQPSFTSNQQENNTNRNFPNGNQNYANQNYPQGLSNENQNYPQTRQPQKSNDIYNNRAQEQSSQPQYKPDSLNVPTNSASNSETATGTLRNPKQYNDVPSFNNRFGKPQGFKDIIASQADQPIANKPTLVAAQIQIVPKDTDIHYRGPGEKEGLPNGISVDHVTQLLYTFNYTVGFHGHHEEGYTNGAKQGYYYVTGRNGIRTRIDYIADEKGFRPRISQEVFDLSSDDVPKPETEKDEKFGLKGYEFKWLYFPADETKKQ